MTVRTLNLTSVVLLKTQYSEIEQHTVAKDIFDFLFGQIQRIQIGHPGQPFDLFVNCLISGYVDVGVISASYHTEVTYKANQIIRIDLFFENFDF